MTSTNDGKEVKSYQAIAQKGKTYYIEFYKSLEAGLSSDCDLRVRTKHLCEAWRRIHSLCQHSTSTTHPHLLSWLQRHTAKIILQTEWQSSTSKNEHISLAEAINDFIAESRAAIKARNGNSTLWEDQLLQRGEWFKKTLFSPWGHATLKKLLDSQNGSPSDEEFLEWLKEERGIMVVTRLRQLAASKCDDLALSLATAIMDRVRAGVLLHTDAEQSDALKEKPKPLSPEPKFAEILKTHAGFTSDIWELLIDIEFVLMHKCDKRSRCIILAKQTPLRACYQLVERLENRLENSPKEKKLWKNAKEVATLIAQVTIARCMVIGGCVGSCRNALYWCVRALTRLVAGARLVADTVALAAPATTSRHLHTLAVAVHAQSTESMKPFVCELYVRALTAGMNELERLKMKIEKETEARALEQTLSSWFTSLGSLLGGSPRVQCECTLTAFSVHPSPLMYDAIKKAPDLPPLHVDIQENQEAIISEFGSWANDSRSQTNFVKTSETLNLKHQKQQSNILSTAILTEGEALGLSPVLCQDIAVLLSGPRLKTLSWDMDRETLLDNCRNYMERTHGGTRALTTELKYLNLDPKEFQHLPEEDDEEENDIFYGIEKGYEHLVEFQPEEIWENANNSQEHSDSPCSSNLDSDCSVIKLKKKSKRVTVKLSEDSDPLSLMAEAKRKAKKKERLHCKERNKESGKKKTVADPLDIEEQTEKDKSHINEKKKNKPGRKKKDKLVGKTGPLSNLVGMKITKASETGNDSVSVNSINDSDYESQGKFSLNSVNSEISDNVVFDGLYSMDELKSPEIHTQTDKIDLIKNNEFCVVNGNVSINKLSLSADCVSDNIHSECNEGNIAPKCVDDQNKEDCTPSKHVPSSLPANINNVPEDVKIKITRLIDFRRYKNTKHRMSERNDVSLISSNDSINNKISNCNKGPESKILKGFTHSDISNGMKRIENHSSNSLQCAATSNVIKKQENKKSNNCTHSDISNDMKRYEITSSNNSINTDILNNIKGCDKNYFNSLTYSDIPNSMKRPENKTSNYLMYTDTSNYIKRSENNFENHVTPKVVTIPNIPKVFISKKPIEETGQLHIINNDNNFSDPVKHLSQKNDHKKPDSQFIACNPFINAIAEPQLKNECLNQNALKEKLLDIAQIHKPNEVTPEQSPIPIQSLEQPKQNKFQNFLKELQKSINAGAAVNSNKCLATQTDKTQREVKPISRVIPVIPSVKKNDIKIPQTVQQSTPERFNSQKKIDTSLNTFSRLSYMHKNRQNDSKLKQVVDALVELQNINLRKCHVSKELDQVMEENKNVNPNYLPSRMNAKKAVTFSVTTDNTQLIKAKAEKLNKTTTQTMKTSPFSLKINTTTQNPQLNFVDNKNESQIRNKSSDKNIVSDIVGSISSSLSEKDQNDLLLLLRQQNKLNKCPVTKRIVATNSEGNNISTSQSSCSGNHIIDKFRMDKTSTLKISKEEQLDKSPLRNSNILCASLNQKIQKSCEFNKLDNNPLISRILSTTPKTSRSLLKNSGLDQHNLKTTEMQEKNGDLSNDVYNKPSKGTTSTDWESVMNAILAQKTPSRGPNALDVALNKSSFAKAFADSIRDNKLQDEKVELLDKLIGSKSDLKHNNKSATKTHHSEKHRSHNSIKGQKHESKKDSTSKHASQININMNKTKKNPLRTIEILNIDSNLVNSLPNSSIIPSSNALSKKTSHFSSSKRLSTDVQKQFTCPLSQEDDPFISGIANSDYDLLEELMDDDLRQEIGELSSDEDNFDISSHNALKKSITNVEKHTNNILNKSSDSVVIKKSDVSIIQNFPESESNRTMPGSILKCESGVRNIYTTPAQANQTYINNNSELRDGSDNTKIYNNPNVRESNSTNNVITSNIETHNKNNFINSNTNKNIISTTMTSPNLVMNTVVPQTFENLILVKPGITYEQISSSQTPLQNNMNTLPASTYLEINKTSDITLYQTTPFVSPVVENKIISVIASQDIPRITPETLRAAEIETSTQFAFAKITKATTDVSSVCKNELCCTKSEGNFNLDDQLKNISYKKGQTQFYLDTSKINERKVPLEVQEKQNFLFERKDQDDLKSTRVMIDNGFKKNNDQDRLEKKRLCIINRKTHHYSSDKPIPLSYTPLKSCVPKSAKIKTELNKQQNFFFLKPAESSKPQRLESLLNVKIQKIQNETVSKISKEDKSKKKPYVKSESKKSKISKVNKSKSVNCQRILLRSSNKIHHRPTIIDTNPLLENDKINGVKQKLSTFDGNETNFGREKVPRPISKKRVKGFSNKSKFVDNGDSVITKKVTRKKRKKKENVNGKFDQLSTNLTNLDLIDIEDQILGSKIPKNETSEPIMKFKSNNASDNTEVSFVNTHSFVQDIPTCNKVSKSGVETQNDVIEVNDSEITDDKRTTEKKNDKVIITAGAEATEKSNTCETNKVEKHRDFIDLTLENKEPAKTTSLIQAKDLNENDGQEKENSICSQLQTKEPNINRKLHNQNCSSNFSSTTTLRNNNLSGIPQSYKDSIKIIPLPPDSSDPMRKFVRIKLPNGRTFKATSYGKQDVDFDTLFSNPSLKSVLLDGLTDKTRYTLNIKQVATTTIDNAKKVVETRIQEIKLEAKNPTGPIETIDLSSDDEDNVTYQRFKTEFGDFKIRSLENNIFFSHQKKFDQNCRVKLISLNQGEYAPELNICDISNTNLRNIEGKVSMPQIEEIVNTNVESTIQNDPDIIEINDISNDTSTFIITNVSEKTSTLNEGINEQTLPVSDSVLSSTQSILLSDDYQSKLSSNETVINSDLEKILCSSLISKYENCYVQLVNCDDVVKKYEKLKFIKQKCFTDLVKSDDTGNLCTQVSNTKTEMEDIGSLEKQGEENEQNTHVLSKTNTDSSFQDLFVSNILKVPMPLLECGMTSPVINAYEKIASLNNNMSKKALALIQLIPTYTCIAEWFVSKPQLSSKSKEKQFTINYNRNALRSDVSTCVSEWYVSKPNLSCQSKITENDNYQNRNSCKLHLKSFHNVPKLTTIVNKYLHINHIMHQTKCISAEKSNPELNHSHNLKRKLSVDHNDNEGRKMSKIEIIRNISVTNYGQDTYNSITGLKSQNGLDNLGTESFDFLTVCYESDCESDVASNNSESILAEHANIFDNMIDNEENALIVNDSKREILQTKENRETFSKEHDIDELETDKSYLYTGLQYKDIKTKTPSTPTVNSDPNKLIKKLEVDDLCKDISKKNITEDHKGQNILDLSGITLESNGILINDDVVKCKAFVNKVESQSKIHELSTGGNNEHDKKMYEFLDTKIKINNETCIQESVDRKLQDNCINNRDELSKILDITSNKNESPKVSTNTIFCEVTPIIFKTTKDGKNKSLVKCAAKNDSTSILPNIHIVHSDKQTIDNELKVNVYSIDNEVQVTKIKDDNLPNSHSEHLIKQAVDNITDVNIYNKDDEVKVTKIKDEYLLNTLPKHSDNQAVDNVTKEYSTDNNVQVKKITDDCLSNARSETCNKQAADNVIKDSFYSLGNEVQVIKVKDDNLLNTHSEQLVKQAVDNITDENIYNKDDEVKVTKIKDEYCLSNSHSETSNKQAAGNLIKDNFYSLGNEVQVTKVKDDNLLNTHSEQLVKQAVDNITADNIHNKDNDVQVTKIKDEYLPSTLTKHSDKLAVDNVRKNSDKLTVDNVRKDNIYSTDNNIQIAKITGDLSKTHSECLVKQAVYNVTKDNIYNINNEVEVIKINDEYLPNTYTKQSNKQAAGNIINDNFYTIDEVHVTKITNNYTTEGLLKVNNNSENSALKVIVSEDPFVIKKTDAENRELKNKHDQPKIIIGNLDHEYAALFETVKHMTEVEISKSAAETEGEKCVFVIDDDAILTDDNITETIVEMHNDEILDDNYIDNAFAFNNKELLSVRNITKSDYDKTETKYLARQEKGNEKSYKLDSHNKNSTTDISNLVDSITNSPDILKVNIECSNKNPSYVPTDMKSSKFNKNERESLNSNNEILQIYEDKPVKEDPEYFKVLIPKVTYANNEKKTKKILKRKIGMSDIKIVGKRYRKSKNIDHPFKQISCTDTLYSKEFSALYNYISSVKFSFSRPFHKENIDVSKMLTDWPIKDSYSNPIEIETHINDVLFMDLGNIRISDPLEQTLSEELSSEYDENKYTVCGISENNFNMGFGEGSGRVIQNLEDGEDSKFSAATLSDVKQIQPFLLSEDYDGCIQDQNAVTILSDPKKDDQLDKIRHYLSYIQLKDKVQAFFRKTSKEFNLLTERNLKSKQNQDFYDTTIFPFGLTHPDFIEPGPVEAIVHVVQVGQLPVTATAQNPVTCDPRVTQVSDASPQCSENSLNDDSQTPIKTEYTELTTAVLSLPLLQEYATHNEIIKNQEGSNISVSNENIPIETEIKSVVKIELMEELSEEKLDPNESPGNCDSPELNKEMLENVDYTFDTNSMNASEADPNLKHIYNSEEKDYNVAKELTEHKQQNVSTEKTDQIAHAMNAAGISTTETVTNNAAHTLINILPENIQTQINNYTKALPNTMSLQQALAQILPPVLNQNGENNQQGISTSTAPQVLHIVQGKNAPGSQITLVDNSQHSVINAPNSTPVLHFVQNKSTSASSIQNGNIQSNTFSGLSLVDTGLQQGGNQLLQIVNTGNQKTNNANQLLKQVNLLTNLTNVQGSNEQKMVQFLCKSSDGKAIQLNGPHPRSMVLRIQPVESPNIQANATKPHETSNLSPTQNLGNHTSNKEVTSQQEIKSRSVYEENYAKFIQNSSAKQVVPEKSTSLPKFNQAFGKQGYQDGDQKQNEINGTNSHLQSLNTSNENVDCPQSENALKLDHIGQMTSPPLLLRKSPTQTTQPQSNFVQQIKQTISPINIQSMHGSVIYRQIPVNLGGGQTINLITVPNTEIADDQNQKQQNDVKFMTQNEMEQSIIKIVPQSQPAPNAEVQQQEENNPHININNENPPTPQQPVLTQMRIKLPMLSKTPQMVSGARVVRPSFFQIQRNVIGANQQVYQQLVLTAAPPLGHQTAIRVPQTQNTRQLKVPNDNPTSSESQMSSSTLEQLREFDLVLEQVKERSTVQPNANTTAPFSQLHVTNDATDSVIATNSTSTESTQQVFYSISNNQPLNMSYVSRKPTIPTPTTSTYVRSPDSSGVVDSPPSSSHTQIPHTVTSDSTTNETPVHHKPAKSSKSKPRPKASSNPPNTLKLNTVPPKTSTQKPIEDEQTTQRILYILAEYKEQVENSPDKDKPAPRRRTNLPPNPGSSKRKKSSSNSRRPGGPDLSPIHGDDTCRTMGSEDSSCGTSQGDCNDCLENNSPQGSPRKVVRKLSFEQETPVNVPRQIPQRNVIVADGQTITVARGTSGKPTTAVLMPANYILPVSMVKGGQQIAIVTNRGPKLLTVTSGDGGTTNALLLQRLITPAGLKPVLTRPGVRHVRLPAAALHSLQAFNLAPVTNINPPDSTVSPAPAPTPPELVDTRANTSPWTERDSQEAKPDRGSSPEGSEPWNLPTAADPNDYSYEETVRTDNMDRTVLIVHKKEGTLHRQHRLTHVSAAALRHKYAILEHELRLQKSLSEECEDLGVDSPSASELFPEAELLFAASPAHDNTQDQGQHSHSHTPQPTHSCISQPDMDDQIATDQLLPRVDLNEQQDLQLGLEDVGIVTVSEDGLQATIALDHEEFARSHPNTTFHSEPTDETEMQPFTITGIKGRHITSTIFHSHRPSGTVLMTAPQTTVISQAIGEGTSIPNTVKYSDIENMIDALPSVHENNLPSVFVKDDGISRFDSILTDSRELHLSNTASAIVHSTGNATQVIRRVCCQEIKRDRDATYLVDESHALIAGDDAKLMAEDSSRDGTMESLHAGVEEDPSSPERHTELFWESNSASERSDSRRPLDFSSDSDKCCKSPFEETNSTDSGGIGSHLRLDSVIKEARGFDRSLGADCSSAEDAHPPLRTYPPKRLYHSIDGELDRSLSGKTGVGDLSEVRRRASGRGVVKRGCHCCNGSPAPPRSKKSRQKKLITTDFTTN